MTVALPSTPFRCEDKMVITLGKEENVFGRDSGENVAVNTTTLTTTTLEIEEVVAGGTAGELCCHARQWRGRSWGDISVNVMTLAKTTLKF